LALLCGTIPALVLSSIVRRRIDRLERNNTQSSNTWSGNLTRSLDTNHPTIHITDLPTLESSAPGSPSTNDMELHQRRAALKVNPDAPFQNIVKTSAFPQNYQAEFDRSDSSAADKAARLRAILVNDQRASLVYVLCVLITLAQVLYMAADGEPRQ
jgi:hypothetical protein